MAKPSYKVVDKGWNKMARTIVGASRVANIGIQGEKGAAERTTPDGGTINNVQLGVIHEFGVPEAGIPERSFMRSTFDANEAEYKRMLDKGYRKMQEGKITADDVLGLIGEKMTSDIKQAINDGIEPENTKATQDRKGSSTPLIDTGAMKNSITYVVKDREGKDGQ